MVFKPQAEIMSQQINHFEAEVRQTVHLDYLLHLPPGYGEDTAKRWPLIMFLHGTGERGNGGEELERVRSIGLAKKLEAEPDLPFIVVSPQCPADSYWPLILESLKALVENISASYAVDRTRVYLTGLSMGGTGTWMLAGAYPDLFAAIAPICGRNISTVARKFANLPTWIFHGDADDVVPLRESQVMYEALKTAGSEVKLTVYPGVGHDSWTETYDNPQLYEWLLSHQR
jgi:predicted peptidase